MSTKSTLYLTLAVALAQISIPCAFGKETSEHDASGYHTTPQVDEISRCPEGWYINTFSFDPTALSNQFSLTCYTYDSNGKIDSSAPNTNSCLACVQGVGGARYDLNANQSNSAGYCIYSQNLANGVCP
ncbi:MAG: hypothetical protein E6Q76_05575 [Rhizobium sp.]|nr:MAG: hypothetical protein E6Q76_05575 [Rhizobium sp.]